MGALQLNLGGAPEGPAGTGKTETCKDLAKAVAKQCVVFNCSDGLDYKAMGKFFKGLAQSGAWACFDEFNRIELEVLSVVAQQIQTIQRAVSERAETFMFEGTQISLDPSCTVFITMNPGYAGRAELPDNLKMVSLCCRCTRWCRCVAGVRDGVVVLQVYEMVSLCCRCTRWCRCVAGVRDGVVVLQVYEMMSLCCRCTRWCRCVAGVRDGVVVLQVYEMVSLCCRCTRWCRCVAGVRDGVVVLQVYEMVSLCCRCTRWCRCVAGVRDGVVVLQVYEMMQVRHGFMLVGGPLGGKSSALRVLAGVLALLEERGLREEHRVDRVIINPKAISMAQLYGSYDAVSHEWSDGVLANVFRKHATSLTPDRKWCVFDGPVDAVWVENMNTVLDDNKKLCLMSGEIIQMSPQQNIIFEVLDLEQASPATVWDDIHGAHGPGLGAVSPVLAGNQAAPFPDLGAETLGKGVLANVFRKHATSLTPDRKWCVFDGPVDAVWVENMNTVLDDNKKLCLMSGEIIQMSPQQNIIFEVLDLEQASPATVSRCGMIYMEPMDLGWEPLVQSWLETKLPHFLTSEQRHLVKLLCEWLLPPCLDFIQKRCRPVVQSSQMHLTSALLKLYQCLLAEISSVDSAVEREEACVETLEEQEESFQASKQKQQEETSSMIVAGAFFSLSDIIVATTETTVQTYFLEKLLLQDKPLLFVGPTGTGKTAITNSFLGQLPPEKYSVCQLSFSAQTSASQVQDGLLTKLERHRKGVYGAPPGRRILLFVDDLSMPAKERYGAQPPIELLRQCTEHGYCFDRKDSSMLHIQDTSIVVAMAPPSGGRQAVTPRFLRHFNVISIDAFSEDTMKSIFQPVMDWHFNRGFENSLKRYSRILVWATTEVYTQTVLNFLPTPSKSHYTFNLRDFSRVIQGLLLLPSEVLPEGSNGAHKLMRLWIHEVHRVFADRLVDDKDRKLFFQLVKGVVQSQFKEKMPSLFGHMVIGRDVQEEDMRGLFFGDYLSPRNTEGAPRHYDEIQDSSQLKQTMERCLEEFNVLSKAPMNLVMFQFAIEHISRLSRVFKQPGGHALLIGIGGSGRQSVTRLAAFMAELELFQVKVQRSYSVSEWRDDLRHVLRGAGQNGTPTVFLFADHQIKMRLSCIHLAPLLFQMRLSYIHLAPLLFQTMERYLEEFNVLSKAPMNLVMFQFAIEHISRLSRVFKQPGGHALLIGERGRVRGRGEEINREGEGKGGIGQMGREEGRRRNRGERRNGAGALPLYLFQARLSCIHLAPPLSLFLVQMRLSCIHLAPSPSLSLPGGTVSCIHLAPPLSLFLFQVGLCPVFTLPPLSHSFSSRRDCPVFTLPLLSLSISSRRDCPVFTLPPLPLYLFQVRLSCIHLAPPLSLFLFQVGLCPEFTLPPSLTLSLPGGTVSCIHLAPPLSLFLFQARLSCIHLAPPLSLFLFQARLSCIHLAPPLSLFLFQARLSCIHLAPPSLPGETVSCIHLAPPSLFLFQMRLSYIHLAPSLSLPDETVLYSPCPPSLPLSLFQMRLSYIHLAPLLFQMQLSPVEEARGSVSPASLYSLFTRLVRSNLHMALAFSPIGEAFRNRLRCFPALLNCCTIDWFQNFAPQMSYGYDEKSGGVGMSAPGPMMQLSPVEEARGSVSPASLYSLFTRLVRSNLHMALAFSPIGEAFRNRLRCFPALLNCCTIDWFQDESFLEDINMILNSGDIPNLFDNEERLEIIEKVILFCSVHTEPACFQDHSVTPFLSYSALAPFSCSFFESLQRRTYVTPTSYLELIKTFKSLLESKRLELLTSKNRYLVGLDKLDFAAAQIALMQEELRELKPLLMERSKETAELLTVIADETLEVEVVKREVEADEATANRAAQEAKAIKEECEQKLSIAMPALNAAITALDTLKASDITLLKTMQNPPSGVRITLAAICILKGIKPEKKVDPNGRSSDDYWPSAKKMLGDMKFLDSLKGIKPEKKVDPNGRSSDDYWPSAKKMLGDMKFLDSLKEFDKDNIPHKVIAQIRRDLISNPEFQPSVIKNVSSACEGLCSWVRAIEVYDKVAKIVAPKRQQLEAAEAELVVQMEKLGVTRAELAVLERAEKLISGLGGEKERWLQISQQLQDTYQNIVGDVLLSAGVVAYLGPFTPNFRQEVLKDWSRMCKLKEIPVSPNFSLTATLGDPVSIMEWQLYGLPRDT
ncbi:UNVERIFIED_CONTAM: hypothetical protein FKN15_029859 [Acipenser sinensis]